MFMQTYFWVEQLNKYQSFFLPAEAQLDSLKNNLKLH